MNHSHGYEMRLQTARELRRTGAEQARKERLAKEVRLEKMDALVRALNAVEKLPALLAAYELTGDHNHGPRSLPVGAPCPGGDCLVHKARAIKALDDAKGS